LEIITGKINRVGFLVRALSSLGFASDLPTLDNKQFRTGLVLAE
jgi:hypothetical protein